jgi:Major Facilitator Superfamily
MGRMLRRPALVAVLTAEVISTTGSLMSAVAIPWFVLVTTHSPARAAWTVGAEILAVGLTGIPSGSLARRLGARRTMLVAELARAPLLALIPALHSVGLLSFPVLVTLTFATGLFTVPYMSSQTVLLPEVVGDDERTVAQANAVLQSATRFTYLAGPALAGFLIGFLGASNVMLIDAATFVVSFCLIAAFVPATRRAPDETQVRGVLAGLSFLLRDPLLRPLTLGQVGSQMAFQGLMIVLPVLAFQRYGGNSRLAGLFLASWGGGALAGNLVAYRLVARFPPLVLGVAAWIGYGLSMWLLVPRMSAAMLFGPLVLSGLFNGLRNPPLAAIRTLRVPSTVRPLSMAASATIATLGGAVSLGFVGIALRLAGVEAVLAALATVATTGALTFAVVSARYSARAPSVPESGRERMQT